MGVSQVVTKRGGSSDSGIGTGFGGYTPNGQRDSAASYYTVCQRSNRHFSDDK